MTGLEYFWVSLIITSLVLENLRDTRYDTLVVVAKCVITIMLDIDIVIRILAVGKPYSAFFSSGRNCFDLLIAITTTALSPPIVQQSGIYPWLVVFYLVRWYRVILKFPRMKSLIVSEPSARACTVTDLTFRLTGERLW